MEGIPPSGHTEFTDFLGPKSTFGKWISLIVEGHLDDEP